MTTRFRFLLALLCAPLLVVGCSDPVEYDKPGPDAQSEAWFQCVDDGDCVLFEAGCCDHCNGGELVSVNASFEADARAAMTETGCSGACTEEGCAQKQAICAAGVCAFEEIPPAACEGLDEAACAANPDCGPILGALAEEICAEDFSNWMTLFGGCMSALGGCGSAESCAVDPSTGQRLIFPSTCTPEGWASCPSDCSAQTECSEGALTAPAQLCVRGELVGNVEVITPENARFEVTPEGCHSSSCTLRHDAFCAVANRGEALEVTASFCLGGVEDAQACTDDCGGGGTARCRALGLEEGAYTARLGDDIELTFELPIEVPFGGLCEGSGF